jgi:very-short-patch-repair endonuclease
MRTPNTECEICGLPLYRRPSELEKVNHVCCRGCRSNLYKRYPQIYNSNLGNGCGWNRGMSKARGDTLSYGKPRSKEIRERISRRLLEVLVKQGETKKCSICGSEFYSYPSTLRRGNGKYCSKRCATIAKNLIQRERGTDIEILLGRWLDENGFEYTEQKPIEGFTITDFFLEPNICLYADGDYWHSIPKTMKRDVWINRQLMKRGYKVVRILGSEIKKGEIDHYKSLLK